MTKHFLSMALYTAAQTMTVAAGLYFVNSAPTKGIALAGLSFICVVVDRFVLTGDDDED